MLAASKWPLLLWLAAAVAPAGASRTALGFRHSLLPMRTTRARLVKSTLPQLALAGDRDRYLCLHGQVCARSRAMFGHEFQRTASMYILTSFRACMAPRAAHALHAGHTQLICCCVLLCICRSTLLPSRSTCARETSTSRRGTSRYCLSR